MSTARGYHRATLLPNGKVLVAGGVDTLGLLASAELYDPATGTFTPTGSMSTSRVVYTATLLPDGKVLVAGGCNSYCTLTSAELYDPATGAFTATGPMSAARSYHTATLLPDGRVLVAGGWGFWANVASAELYDPATRTFTPTGSMSTGRAYHRATLLPNGKVLVAGGADFDRVLASAELYDPATGAFTATGAMSTARRNYTATLLPNGKALVAGGWGGYIAGHLPSAELYDPATGAFTATGPMSAARAHHTATPLLSNGKVLVAGGGVGGSVDPFTLLASAELYDPVTGAFTATGAMSAARRDHTATLLPNGAVLVAGGYNSPHPASAELYGAPTPAQLLQQLIDLVASYNLKQGISNSLDAKLQNASDALQAAQANDLARACNLVTAFMNEVQAQSGKSINTSQADALLALALQVKQALGCA